MDGASSHGCFGDQSLHVITKTKKREIMFGNTPEPEKMQQFGGFADSCNVTKIELAQKILAMTWDEKMEFICQQFSADKQVLKVLQMAKDNYDDQEPKLKRSKHFTSVSRREEQGSLEDNSGDKEERLVKTPSVVEVKKEKESKTITVKPAPDGLYYKKRLILGLPEPSSTHSLKTTSDSLTTKDDINNSDTLDSIFSDNSKSLTMSPKKSYSYSNEIRNCDETLDDIFK